MSEPVEKELFNKAVELLSRREHSQAELKEKLQRRIECSEEVVGRVLERLLELGYQSDERFATAFIRSRLGRGLGARRVMQEAKQKGLSSQLVEQVIEREVQADFRPEAMIEQVWRKKFKAIPSDQKERAKQYRFLQYRGFSGSEIGRLFDHLKECDGEL